MSPWVARVTVGGLVAIAGTGSSSAGAVNTRMEFQVSPAGLETWSSGLSAAPGQSIDVRVRVTYTGTASPLGLGSINFQPVVSNWDDVGGQRDTFGVFANGVGDSYVGTPIGHVPDAPGRYGRITGWARSGTTQLTDQGRAIQHDGTTFLRIAKGNVTSWQSGSILATGSGGVETSQWTPGYRPATALPFDTRLSNIVLLKFNITLSSDALLRDMIATAPQELIGNYNDATGEREAHWVADTMEGTGSIGGGIDVIPATIHVPTPGGMGVLATGILLGCRRR